MEKIYKWVDEKYKIVFAILLILGILLRTIFLDSVPQGINVDEAGMAYDAYCLANYGVDRQLNHNPVYLNNFGTGQSALYAYITSIFIKIFGVNIITIRLASVILGIMITIFAYLIGAKLKNRKTGLLFMALVVIFPWHIMSSRWGLDCNLMAGMIFISIYMLICSDKWIKYLITGILFGLTLYTYAMAHMAVVVLIIRIMALFIKNKENYNKKYNYNGYTSIYFRNATFIIPFIKYGNHS